MGAFGLIAIAPAIAGVYGTIAFTVARRYREIGLRLALGATSSRVLSNVLGLTILLAYVAVAGLILLIGIMAALFPAVRAARLDPASALRDD